MFGLIGWAAELLVVVIGIGALMNWRQNRRLKWTTTPGLGCNMQGRFKGFRIRRWIQLDAVDYAVVLAVASVGLLAVWVVVTQDQGLPIEQTRFRVEVDVMEGGQSARFSADTSGAPTSVRTARGEWRALVAGEELVTPVTLTIPPGPFVAQFTSLGASPPLDVKAQGGSVNLHGIGYEIVVQRTRTQVGFGEDSQFLSQTGLR